MAGSNAEGFPSPEELKDVVRITVQSPGQGYLLVSLFRHTQENGLQPIRWNGDNKRWIPGRDAAAAGAALAIVMQSLTGKRFVFKNKISNDGFWNYDRVDFS